MTNSSRRIIWQIARHEVRAHWRDRTLPIAVLGLTLLLLVAALTTRQNQQQREKQRTDYQQIIRQNWLDQPDRHPHRSSHYGYLAFRPAGPGAFIDEGVESFLGNSVFLEAHRQNPANFSEASLTGGLIRFGILSPALIILLLAPLLIFFLGYSIVSGERENGTLPLLFALGAARRQILVGKGLALFTMALAMVVPGMGIILLLAGLGSKSPTGQQLWRLGGLSLGYTVYLLICCLGCLIVSTLCRRSRTALLLLIIGWVVGGVVMPRGLAAIGEHRTTLPSRAEFDARLEDALEKEGDSHDPDDPHFQKLRMETLKRYNVNRVEDLPFNYGAFVMLEAETISSSIFRRQYLELLTTMEDQNRLAIPASLINPYQAIRAISMALAGSDHRHFVSFQQQAEDFRLALVQRLNTLHLEKIRYENDRAQRVSREHWDDFPEFAAPTPEFQVVIRTLWFPLLGLGIWLAVLLVTIFLLHPEKIR